MFEVPRQAGNDAFVRELAERGLFCYLFTFACFREGAVGLEGAFGASWSSGLAGFTSVKNHKV